MQKIEENKLEEALFYEFQDQLIQTQFEVEQKRLEKVEAELDLLPDDEELLIEYNSILSRMANLKEQLDRNVSSSEDEIIIDVADAQKDDVSVAEIEKTPVIDDMNNQDYSTRVSNLPKIEKFLTFEIPNSIKTRLFDYQIDGVNWMVNLYKKGKGGISSDEMGLGKSIQAVAFLAGLACCNILKNALVVTPGTLLIQWMQVFHHWFPHFRVIVYHNTMTTSLKKLTKILKEREIPIIIITTYESIRLHNFFKRSWDCCILDEGHKIRNDSAQITKACKQIKTPYRFILSGTPIQNSLKELWCLMDFVYPGLLGTLDIFESQFIVPINLGGYTKATSMEVNAAYSCTLSLKKLIDPHFLRRLKKDVAKQLPKKSEYVLICELTSSQYTQYCNYIESEEASKIFNGKLNILVGIDMLRKIANHLDLISEHSRTQAYLETSVTELASKSGKCKILLELMTKWNSENVELNSKNKLLLFCQTRQMLDILERLIFLSNFKYLRMDGNTSMKNRPSLVDNFNQDDEIFVFLLTTKTGGLGLNLTGANKVIIFDCDFNPSNDEQSRERTYRLGQKREVEIYRLISSKTIEEKIYHRQIFKKFLANKILDDPHHKRFFKFEDMKDLFAKPDLSNIAETRKEISSIAGKRKTFIRKGSGPEQPTKDKIFDILQNKSVKALNHDNIMQSGSDTHLVQREAERIAQNALAALRESRKVRHYEMSEVLEPMLKKRRLDKNHSSSILAGLRVKKQIDSGSPSAVRSVALLNEGNKEAMITEICSYLKHCKPSTKEIISKFCSTMSSSDKAIFSKMLKGIAILKKLKESSYWELKDEFR
eukprot:NODE_204_length_12954_cov_1.347880.p3 type:complete len:826 gc:universal NODE_204_length_12954_cov_1.347880:796-3273(+)